MIRHIFIGTFKAEIDTATKNAELADLRAMKEKIPGIVDLNVNFSTGWIGSENSVVITADFATKADFDAYIAHPYHADYLAAKGAEYFSGYVAAQFEL